jgi:hypothetical protein
MPAAKLEIRMSQAAINRMLGGATGPVMKDLIKRGRRVQRNARAMAPGRMGRKINAVIVDGHVRVESNHEATMFVIKGTRPHIIRPRYRQVLKFTSRGNTVFARVVHHPGTKKNDFLTKALRKG